MTTVQQILDEKGNDVWTIDPDDTMFNAITEMARRNVGALVVIEHEKLVGIVSERDYARNVFLKGKSSPETPVRDIMVTRVICARLDQSVDDCLAVMTERKVRHLPVLQKKKLVGMISIGDLVKRVITGG